EPFNVAEYVGSSPELSQSLKFLIGDDLHPAAQFRCKFSNEDLYRVGMCSSDEIVDHLIASSEAVVPLQSSARRSWSVSSLSTTHGGPSQRAIGGKRFREPIRSGVGVEKNV